MEQERVRFNLQDHKHTFSLHTADIDLTLGGRGLASGSAEAGEVMFAKQSLSGAVHSVRIQAAAVPDSLRQVRVWKSALVVIDVVITTRSRAVTSMERSIYFNHPRDVQICLSQTIEPT